jgi:hypothetical protein
MLANPIWSFAGDDDRPDINNSFVQPFAAYTWPSARTASVQTETRYDWESEQWSEPVNTAVSKLVIFGELPVGRQGGCGLVARVPGQRSGGCSLSATGELCAASIAADANRRMEPEK